METEQTNELPKPKSTRKPAKKRARTKAKPAPAPKQDGAYAGISPANCPTACSATACVISGRGICAHPYKGGLQASLQTPDAVRRLNEAKRVIGKRKLDVAAE
jgi:hypothetical protein